MTNKIYRRNMIILATCGLVACGGGGGGNLAGGGISGSGIGTITGFGSVIINDIRTFVIDANTTITWDDNIISETELMNRGVGAVAQVNVAGANNGLTSGTAVTITVNNKVKGPVTGTAPLEVLGQTLVLDGNVTYLVDDTPAPGFNPATLQVGDIVEVNGFAGVSNVIQVSLFEHKTAGIPEWKLTGKVTSTAPGELNIGSQRVVLNGVNARDCRLNRTTPEVGDLVEVKALFDAQFNTGAAPNDDTLDTVTDVECQVPGLGVPPGTSTSIIEAEIEGIVTALACPGGDFVVGGQCVEITSAPAVFEGGAAEDIIIGAKLEAEGDLNTASGVLVADRIKFRENRVRIEAPVNIPIAGVGGAFTIMDVIPVTTTTLTEDSDGIITGSISGNHQVEVRGYADSTGTVFATSLRERGNADLTDVRLRGPTDDTCNPPFDTELTVLGVIIDTNSSVPVPPLLYINEAVEPNILLADQDAFCALVNIGTNIEVETGIFTNVVSPRIEDAEQYSIEDL